MQRLLQRRAVGAARALQATGQPTFGARCSTPCRLSCSTVKSHILLGGVVRRAVAWLGAGTRRAVETQEDTSIRRGRTSWCTTADCSGLNS